MTEKTSVRLRHPLFRTSLRLSRVPRYLRFTVRGWASCARHWDALDQPDDQPEPEEQVIAAQLVHRGTVHIDGVKNGRRFGKWLPTAEYAPLQEQPNDDTLRDANEWREWCLSREAAHDERNDR